MVAYSRRAMNTNMMQVRSQTWRPLTWSDFGECAVALVERLTIMRKRVTRRAMRPGTMEAGTRKLAC